MPCSYILQVLLDRKGRRDRVGKEESKVNEDTEAFLEKEDQLDLLDHKDHVEYQEEHLLEIFRHCWTHWVRFTAMKLVNNDETLEGFSPLR